MFFREQSIDNRSTAGRPTLNWEGTHSLGHVFLGITIIIIFIIRALLFIRLARLIARLLGLKFLDHKLPPVYKGARQFESPLVKEVGLESRIDSLANLGLLEHVPVDGKKLQIGDQGGKECLVLGEGCG